MSSVYEELKTLRRDLDRLKRLQLQRPSGTSVLSRFLALPELRAFWGFGSINESGNAIDSSGQGRTLTNNGSTPRAVLASGLPYCTLNGSTQYWSRADEAGLDITGHLTVGGWFYASNAASPGTLIAKMGDAGPTSYRLDMSSGKANFFVSGDGAATVVATSSRDLVSGQWHFIVGRFYPNLLINAIVDGVAGANTTSIPAAIYNSANALAIGARATGATKLAGGSALCFVCAAALAGTLLTDLYYATAPLFE